MASIPVAEFSIGAGDVYLDGQPLGSTRENNVFRIVQNLAAPTINGVGGILARTDYHNTLPMAELEITLLELSGDTLPVMVPGADVDDDTEDTVIGPPTSRRVQGGDYHKWEVRVPGLSGRELRYTIEIGIVTSNVELANADDGSQPAGARLTIQSRINPDDTTQKPWTLTRKPPTYS